MIEHDMKNDGVENHNDLDINTVWHDRFIFWVFNHLIEIIIWCLSTLTKILVI